jgi:hypothetical protein
MLRTRCAAFNRKHDVFPLALADMIEPIAVTQTVHASPTPAAMQPWLLLTAGALAVVVLVALPYLPGNYDALAVPLSAMMQLFGLTGLILVGFGLLWCLLRQLPGRRSHAQPASKVEYRFASAAVITATVVLAPSALLATSHAGPILGLLLALIFVTSAGWLLRRIRNSHIAPSEISRWGPRYLILIPLTATAARFLLVPAMGETSRARAMDNAGSLIAAIEQYQQQHGRYPVSLASLNTDFRPALMGVRRYVYEPTEVTYNLFFEHLAHAFDTREIIMYNPRGAHQMTSHDADLLEYSGSDLELRRGYYAIMDAARPNWKRFLFD